MQILDILRGKQEALGECVHGMRRCEKLDVGEEVGGKGKGA